MKQPIIFIAKGRALLPLLQSIRSWPVNEESSLRRWHIVYDRSGLITEVAGYEYSDRVEIVSIVCFS